MNFEITKVRREKLYESMDDGQAVIVFANQVDYLGVRFLQENNFLYLTGLQTPEAIYFLAKIKNKSIEMLFIQRGIPEREVWDGKKMSLAEAKEQTGINNIKYLDELYASIGQICPLLNTIYANIGIPALDKPLSYQLFMLQPIIARHSRIVIENLDNIMRGLRSIKTKWEIEQLQHAIDITGEGIEAAMRITQAGMMEYELEAEIFYTMQKKGVMHWGFAPIIGSGINAATLHYGMNNCKIGKKDIVLMDVGALFNNYSADITRCFPVSGTFSKRQKEVYSEVLNIQKTIISMIKPGIGLTELNEKTIEMMGQALIKLKLISDSRDYQKYYMHSISHHLGMNTHDLGMRDSILEEGNIITVEPGIYIPEENLGIRIEDDILVTAKGNVNLSKKIPKEIKDIETIRKSVLKK